MNEFEYVTVLDSDIGTHMIGGGHVIVCRNKETPAQVFRRAAQKAKETSARRFRLMAHGGVSGIGLWGGWGISMGGEDYAYPTVAEDWSPLRDVFEGIVLNVCSAADVGPDAQTKGNIFRAGDGKFYCSRIASITNTQVFASDAIQIYMRFIIKMFPWRGNVYRFDPNRPPLLIQGTDIEWGWEAWKGGLPPT